MTAIIATQLTVTPTNRRILQVNVDTFFTARRIRPGPDGGHDAQRVKCPMCGLLTDTVCSFLKTMQWASTAYSYKQGCLGLTKPDRLKPSSESRSKIKRLPMGP